nr:PREDICTED: probable glutamate receptor isoform X8 [Megachile rotundata]
MQVGGIVVQVFRDGNVNLRQDYTILLSFASCYLTWRLHEAAANKELMHLAITDPDCPRIPETDGLSVPLIMPGKELSQIFLDLRMTNILSWNVINILHDDTFDRDTISRVMKAISDKLPNRQLSLVSRSIFTLKHEDTEMARKKAVKKILDDFHVEQLGHCFLVIATVDMVVDVMTVARSLRMVHPGSQWLYVVTNTAPNRTNITSFVELLAEGGNVAFIYNATDFNDFCETLQVKVTYYAKKLVQALAKALEYSLTNEIDMLKRVGGEDFEMIRLTKRERRKEILTNFKMYLERDVLNSETVHGRCVLWKFTSSITWGNFFSHVILPEVNSTKPWSSSRFSKLGDKINEMTMSNTRRVPKEVIKLVREKKVLLAACAYTVQEYEDTINFTVPVFVQTYSFLTTRPRQLSRALLFASPFTKETWFCLAVTVIIMGPILYLIHKYSPYSTKTSGLNSSWQCVWYVYGALLQQGGMYLPQSDSARMLIGVWWLIVMVVVATYSGSLVAFLTFPKMDASILTVEDLIARKDKITWGFPNDSFLELYLRNTDEQKYQILLAYSERHNDTEEETLVERVKQGKHALIDWRSSLRFLMRKDLLLTGGCHFSLSADEFLDEPIAMIIPQDSPYLAVIDAELRRMQESGLMNKWISEKMPMKDKCWEVPGSNQAVNKRKVNVADMQGIFFVLFMGVTLSFLFLFCELYWNKRKVSKERKLIRPFVS